MNDDFDIDAVINAAQAAARRDALREAYELMYDGTEMEIQIGDLVEWKHPRLANKGLPEVGRYAIACAFPDAIVDGASPGTAYFREPLTLITGILDCSGDYIEFHQDRRRFRKVSHVK